ncbi:LysM peptidoglycan-binding domain-containing protein [Spirosoma utsteinense]|uniref:Membrane-bound lytic murein transglycosylase D n=1 Tax=Spirosoma utsteinense TaxID=2585773 RepID=A0ABR6W3G0_9BACT|nr:LysM peptidoglycan-binding domain-containing protein [Spirosoma utsteinense]MBC3784842.1 membrane-bound lytic murein transglycosylase D [Spirosoma utsteinense]MBC3791120.1 membrane-bound lytic murein transglycosylase D [Spirosoma utsteinense]
MNVKKVLIWVIVAGISLLAAPGRLNAQALPEIPFDIDFGGVTVHLNEQGREQLQREVGRLYANRARLYQDIESLRQLTPLLEPLLKAERLPVDYRYAVLPFSSDGSVGYWGLTPDRALALKMLVNSAVDERYHPILATQTVAADLNRLQATSDNYFLTLLRYVQGDTLADRLANNVKANYLLLDAQSPALIWTIMARKLAFEREEPLLRPAQTYLLYEYRNSGGASLRTISRQLQIDEERFKPFNDWLRATLIPDEKAYPVLIRVTNDEFPTVKGRDELRLTPSVVGPVDIGFPTLTKLPRSTVSTFQDAVFYTINDRLGVQAQPCDNVITLAHYGKIDISTLLEYNELSDRDVVLPGQIYYLERKAKRAKIPFHVVQKNQTLREVSNLYGVRLKSLLKYNRIQLIQRVQTGRILWLRSKRPRKQPVEYRQLPIEELKPMIDDTLIARPMANTPTVELAAQSRLTDSLARQKVDSVSTKPTRTAQSEPIVRPLVNAPEIAKNRPNEVKEAQKLHIVKRGQTYYSISQLYKITLKQLYTWNDLAERIPLEIGQKLIVGPVKRRPALAPKPRVVTRVAPTSTPAPVTKAGPSTVRGAEPAGRVYYHIVRRGQTVYRVALINKVSVPDLMRWNSLKNYTIEVGQKLVIRKPQ